MARVVVVHGIGQQYLGPRSMHIAVAALTSLAASGMTPRQSR
jgi:hypothetical protein